MQAVRRRDTDAELAVRTELHRLGLRFRVDVAPIAGMRRRADILFPRLRLAVFIDGCFWHGCPEHATWPKTNAAWWKAKILGNVERDRDTGRRLTHAGWTVRRIWAHSDPELAAHCIALEVKTRLRIRNRAS